MATVGKKGKPGPGDRGTEAPQPSDSKRFKQEIKSSQQSESGASAASSVDGSSRSGRSPQHVASGILNRTATSAAATASILKAQKTKQPKPKEKKDGCCLKSSSTSSQNLHDQASSGSSTPQPQPQRSPKSSIFTRFLHRQSHGAADGDGQKNPKGSKADGQQSKSPKSPKSRLSDGRLKLFNRTSSIKEVKIALPASGKSTVAKSSGQHGASRSSLRQPTIREKTSAKTKDAGRSKISFSLTAHQSHEKQPADHSPEPSATKLSPCNLDNAGNPVKTNGIAAVSPGRDAAGATQHGHVEDMDTSAAKDEVPKCRRESVQAWVNSISDERLDGVEDMEQQDAAASGAGVTMEVTQHDPIGAGHGVKAEDDDLTLGAEAKLLTPGKDVTLSRSTKHRLAEVGASSGRNRQSAWREMFSSIKTESFNSEGSAHTARTWDSIEQLLQERTGDPVEILTNLGFHSQESDESLPSRIPDRFLRQQSAASGISVEKFIESNPDLKEYVSLTRSLSEPSTASLAASGDRERKPSARKPSIAGSCKSFASMVKTLTFIHRLAARMSWKEIDMTRKFLTPTDSATARHQSVRYAAVAPSGKAFTSILHPDNSQHRAEQGVYDETNSRRASAEDITDSAGNLQSRVLPSLDLSKIPGRFSPVPPAHDPKDITPSPVRSPIPSPIPSGRNSPNVSLDRIPARFSPTPSARDSVTTPPPTELLTPPMTNGKRGSLSVPAEPRSRSASLWKRLSDAGRELEQVKNVQRMMAQPRNIIDVTHPGRCPDVPLRFLIHSQQSILNTSFNKSLDLEDEEKISTDKPKASGEETTVQKEQESTEKEKVIHAPDSSAGLMKRPSVQVLLRQPTEDEETPGEVKLEDVSEQNLIQRLTKLQKRRSDSLETTNKPEDSVSVESESHDEPSKKVRRKLGSMCRVTDQAKLLQSLDLDNQDNITLQTETEKPQETPEGDSNMVDVNDNALLPRLSVASTGGLADDEEDEESNKILTRREKASKFLRKFLSQQEDEKGDESDSDGSVGDPAEPVEFGTAVMVKVLATRVVHKWRKPETVAPIETPEEEQSTTDQGSVSGDDIEDIYAAEGMDVDLDEAIPDSSAIGSIQPSICALMTDTDMVDPDISNVNSVRSDDTDASSCESRKSEHIRFDCNPDSHQSPKALMQEINETPRRRVTICSATVELEQERQKIDRLEKGPRTSDSGIDYQSLLYIKRRRFSRQDHVVPPDLVTNSDEIQTPEANSESKDAYSQDMDVRNSNNEYDDVDSTVPNSTKADEQSHSVEMSPKANSDIIDENCNSTIAFNTTSDMLLSNAHHGQCNSPYLPSDRGSIDDKEETDTLNVGEECFVDPIPLRQSEPAELLHAENEGCAITSVVVGESEIDRSNGLLCGTLDLDTEPHDIANGHHVVDQSEKEKQTILIGDTSLSDKTEHVQHDENILASVDLNFNETIKEEITALQSSATDSEKAKDNQDVQRVESPSKFTVLNSSNNICDSNIPQLSSPPQEQGLRVKDEEVVKSHTEITSHTTKVGDEDLILPQISLLVESFQREPDSGMVYMDIARSPDIVPMIEDSDISIVVPDVSVEKDSDVTTTNEVPRPLGCVPAKSMNEDEESTNSYGSSVIVTSVENHLHSNGEIEAHITEHAIVCENTPGLEMVLTTNDQELTYDRTSDIETDAQTESFLPVQIKEPLIVSLGGEGTASPVGSEHGNSDGDEDLLLAAKQARKMSFLRYTESDRDDSIRSETDDSECIFQEHLIDDNVLDRSLSEQSYLVDLLDQLKQNKSMQSVQRSNSVGTVEHRLSSVFPPVELVESVQKEMQTETVVTPKGDVTVMDYVNTADVVDKEDYGVKVFGANPIEVVCVPPIPNQQSFDLEEVSSEDFVGNSLPKVSKAGGPALQRPFSRAFSAQSDSSGFVEMEGTEIDWRELKILGLGSSADSESSSRRSSHGAPVHKRSLRWDRQALNMGTTQGKPVLYSDDNQDAAVKSDDTADDAEESLWNIVENGHAVTHKDFLFGVPQRLKERESAPRPRARRRSRKQRPPPLWTSRLYIDPPISPKVTSSSKMEVKFTIDKGQIQDIENAQAIPVDPPKVSNRGYQRAVSYLCLSVSQDDGNFEITPVDKGDFSLPALDLSKVDVSQHQVICSLLRRSSTGWKPDEETLRQFTIWNSTDAAERREHNAHLIEEVKLIQHAITKFKVEFRVLDLRTNSIYNQRPESITEEQRSELVDLANLRSQIMQEIAELERRLGERMRILLGAEGGMYPGDLSSLQTVQQVVEVLKEQVYHSSVIHGMALPGPSTDTQPENSNPDLVHQLSVLQGHMEEHQSKTTTQLTSTMDQMRQALLAEVRESVQKETEDLRKQVLSSQTEVRNLKEQLQVYTNVPAGAFTPPGKNTEVRFPISTSPVGQLTVNAPTMEVISGQSNGGPATEDQLELQVSQSHRAEESPIERGFRPISKQESDDLEHM